MELVLPTYNAQPYFSLKNLGKNYALYMAKYGRQSHLGVMGDTDTWTVLLIFSLLCNLTLVAVTAENPASQRYDAGNGSRFFCAFVSISGYFAFTLTQNVWRSEVVSNLLNVTVIYDLKQLMLF